jgi:hypothetical protein
MSRLFFNSDALLTSAAAAAVAAAADADVLGQQATAELHELEVLIGEAADASAASASAAASDAASDAASAAHE